MESRQQVRQAIALKRRNLNPAQKKYASRLINQQILSTSLFRRGKYIAFYMSHNGEVNDLPLLRQALGMKKHCYLPVLHPLKHNRLLFVAYKAHDRLIRNRYGILEPQINTRKIIPAWCLSLVLMPLVAFDINGNRLGSGKGYYDRSFAFLKQRRSSSNPVLIGLAYELQKTHRIESQHWDIPVNFIVTEKQIYKCTQPTIYD